MHAGFRPHVAYQSTYWDFITEMVSQNLGISILPESVGKKVDQRIIKVIPIENPSISWKLGIISKKGRYISYAAKEMVRYISSSRNS